MEPGPQRNAGVVECLLACDMPLDGLGRPKIGMDRPGPNSRLKTVMGIMQALSWLRPNEEPSRLLDAHHSEIQILNLEGPAYRRGAVGEEIIL